MKDDLIFFFHLLIIFKVFSLQNCTVLFINSFSNNNLRNAKNKIEFFTVEKNWNFLVKINVMPQLNRTTRLEAQNSVFQKTNTKKIQYFHQKKLIVEITN